MEGINRENIESKKEAIYLGCNGGGVEFFAVDGFAWEISGKNIRDVQPACDCCMSYSINEYCEKNGLKIPKAGVDVPPEIEILNRSRDKFELMEFEKSLILKIESLIHENSYSDALAFAKIVGIDVVYDERNAVINLIKGSEVVGSYKLRE